MIKGWILGGDDLVRRLTATPENIQSALQASVSRMALRLLARVKADKLSGQVLKVKSGRLRRSINERVVREGQGVYGYVGTNVDYGRVHEYGFKGAVSVKEHLRRSKSQMRKAMYKKNGEVKFSKKGKGNGEILVRAHTRNVNLPERSFLRSALRELQPEIERSMRNAVQAAAKRATK